jgi:hypothetical protein
VVKVFAVFTAYFIGLSENSPDVADKRWASFEEMRVSTTTMPSLPMIIPAFALKLLPEQGFSHLHRSILRRISQQSSRADRLFNIKESNTADRNKILPVFFMSISFI